MFCINSVLWIEKTRVEHDPRPSLSKKGPFTLLNTKKSC
jgi:hypothetical protein